MIFSVSILLSRYKKGEEDKNLDYVLLIGCELENNVPSPTMLHRLRLAVKYAEENPATLFVLVGGRGRHSASAESSVMFQRLLWEGIPSDRLLMEFYSKNTEDKIRFGLNSIEKWIEERYLEEELVQSEKGYYPEDSNYTYIKEESLEWEDRPPDVGIISSQYQLFQCVRFAEKENSFYHYRTLSAKEPPYLIPHYYVREAITIVIRSIFNQL